MKAFMISTKNLQRLHLKGFLLTSCQFEKTTDTHAAKLKEFSVW